MTLFFLPMGRDIQVLRDNAWLPQPNEIDDPNATFELVAAREWHQLNGLNEILKRGGDNQTLEFGLHSDLAYRSPHRSKSFMSIAQVARHLKLSESRVQNMASEGEGPRSVKFGRERWFFSLDVKDLWTPLGYEPNSWPSSPPQWEEILEKHPFVDYRVVNPNRKPVANVCVKCIGCGGSKREQCLGCFEKRLRLAAQSRSVRDHRWVEFTFPLAQIRGKFGEKALLERSGGCEAIEQIQAALSNVRCERTPHRVPLFVGQPVSIGFGRPDDEIIGFYGLVGGTTVEKVTDALRKIASQSDLPSTESRAVTATYVDLNRLEIAIRRLGHDSAAGIKIEYARTHSHIKSVKVNNPRGDRIAVDRRLVYNGFSPAEFGV